jgi:hypothetical protein
MGIDPGGKDIGVVVRKESGEIVFAAHLETRSTEVAENMKERQMHRRNRRQHHREVRKRRAKKANTCFAQKCYIIARTKEKLLCKKIKPKPIRFHNRRRCEGWLTPTASHLLETHENIIGLIGKMMPITKVCLEYGKFDLHKLENPEIEGVQYQNGRKKGYGNTQEYVLCRDRHKCQLCGKDKGTLHVHHVLWASQGGSDSPENLITLCTKCHDRVHHDTGTDAKVKELFEGICKKYVHTTLFNTIMPSFRHWLTERFPKVCLTYGYETKEKRRNLNIAKSHIVDAYLISFPNEAERNDIVWDNVVVYEYRQFRRHHRQIIHATRERNYKDGTKIVAKNRKKRTGQTKDSLADLVAKKGEQILARLRVLPGKKVIRSGFNELRKGDVVRYNDETCVIKGYGEMGQRVGFVAQKEYVSTQACALIMRNAGLVCL